MQLICCLAIKIATLELALKARQLRIALKNFMTTSMLWITASHKHCSPNSSKFLSDHRADSASTTNSERMFKIKNARVDTI